MKYIDEYISPVGKIFLCGDENGLTDLWFQNQKYYENNLENYGIKKEIPIFKETKMWLSIYFSGKNPNFTPKINITGTQFSMKVLNELCKIPYGETITYGEISKKISENQKMGMLSRAVGKAISKNRISIIIPCHRVIGKNKKLTGYAGGIHIKIFLLSLEGLNF